LKINLFSPWYSSKSVELALSNNRSLTLLIIVLSVLRIANSDSSFVSHMHIIFLQRNAVEFW